jgi:hypothetical protein
MVGVEAWNLLVWCPVTDDYLTARTVNTGAVGGTFSTDDTLIAPAAPIEVVGLVQTEVMGDTEVV